MGRFLASSGNQELFEFVKNEVRITRSSGETDARDALQVQTPLGAFVPTAQTRRERPLPSRSAPFLRHSP